MIDFFVTLVISDLSLMIDFLFNYVAPFFWGAKLTEIPSVVEAHTTLLQWQGGNTPVRGVGNRKKIISCVFKMF